MAHHPCQDIVASLYQPSSGTFISCRSALITSFRLLLGPPLGCGCSQPKRHLFCDHSGPCCATSIGPSLSSSDLTFHVPKCQMCIWLCVLLLYVQSLHSGVLQAVIYIYSISTWIGYGPCHCARSLLGDVGNRTSTWSPDSNCRCRALRSYHHFCCRWAPAPTRSSWPASCALPTHRTPHFNHCWYWPPNSPSECPGVLSLDQFNGRETRGGLGHLPVGEPKIGHKFVPVFHIVHSSLLQHSLKSLVKSFNQPIRLGKV